MTTGDSNSWFDQAFRRAPLMAILRGFGTARSLELAATAWDLGLDCVEVPIQTPADVEALAAVVEAGAARGKQVGAGTVVMPEHVAQAHAAGAAFTVSPGFDPEVVQASLAAGMPSLPGVATPSEIQLAAKLGLLWLKAFPASELGTGWFKAVCGPFPQLKFVATGGLDAGNAADYLDAGVRVVAVGSALQDPNQLGALAGLLTSRNRDAVSRL
ncbi:bifunctional 4-hydroxy-2-oxoglutarate aldolase/2-dehydro-3-deoxy-phosphogluconate aldolase [Paenarthrobacter sp. DKR-5]|uniref:bifunctional 4-hydroxy-2-oxoglutarate aldolase/2-dehydro-3-deoxy-phosphogluconate aldolase n=1 Tax=Paenarthrobacter sp. DKR-5 TaxID=2835535 RepID=UPI001BDC5919|nr:bifunctional 4-hydroxy-2-oxoglutarate aldolase/2-dehydro-3-deoxy-phosphogluconate aldolase [Paenarthrobacter sp. DKR-5]MBT1001145.1 bifunctional 4-hydroxy-2-oxoglutarate aldolase/2-dehydro-3-deoxy-phosphogluconate aldolase [Paenarthrobacter sp. DKR-5]